MKPVFICHQLAPTEREDSNVAAKQFRDNIESVRRICQSLYSSEINPIGVHLYYPQFMNDKVAADRSLGIQFDHHLLRHYILPSSGDLWVYGPREDAWLWDYEPRISSGMHGEIMLCKELGIPVKCKDPRLEDLVAAYALD